MIRLVVLWLALTTAISGLAQAPATLAVPSPAPSPHETYAQYLVNSTVARHPELIELDVHAAAPGSPQSVIVAAKDRARVGKASDADDIAVLKSEEPRVEINRRGDQNAEVELVLFDIYKQAIGSAEFTFPYPPGTDQQALVGIAARYRDEMSRRILGPSSLFETVQLDPRVPTHQYAQFLVDDILGRHPEIEVIVLHARTPQTGAEYPIVASNIGRIGKPADESDLEVIRTGKPHSAADASGRRFESKIPVQDAAGATLGAVAVIYPYGAISNAAALESQAEKIAAELRSRIATAASLEAPYPAGLPTELVQPIEEYNKQLLGNKQDLPMTKEVVSGQQLAQSTQEGYSDAIKNQAGIAPTNSSGSTNDAFAIRGIKLNLFSNYRLDGGLPIAGVITMPTEDKSRVETLKGANALMFGVASPAGIINFVTKRAGPRDVTSFGVAGNSFGQYGGSVDIGRRFGPEKQVGLRINASETHLENGVHNLGGSGDFASAGLDYRVTSRLNLQADIEYYSKHVPEQAGISLLSPVNGVVPITPVPNPRNNLIDGWNQFAARTDNYQARADYAITDDWKVLAQAGQSVSHRHRNTVRIGGYDIVTGANGIVSVQPITNDYQNTFYRAEVLGHFDTWVLTHDLTLGSSHTERKSSSYDLQNLTLPQRQNIFDPIELAPPVLTKPGTANPPQNSKDTDYYAYDSMAITRQLKVLAGLRYVDDTEVVGDTVSKSHVRSPGYGVLYDILPTTTLFASYLEGLEAGGTAPANAANANVILAPAISRQKEIGIRDSYFKGLSLSASYFEITRANAVIDPITNVFGYNGNLSFKGVETTASYNFLRDWTVNVAALWLDAIQNSPLQPLIDGRVPENTPKWNGNLGVSYRVPWVAGLTLRAGAKLISRRPVNPQDQNYIPGYTLYDAGVNYTTLIAGRRVALQLSADNAADKRYWNSVQTGTYGIGMVRSFKLSAKVDF